LWTTVGSWEESELIEPFEEFVAGEFAVEDALGAGESGGSAVFGAGAGCCGPGVFVGVGEGFRAAAGGLEAVSDRGHAVLIISV
jgi:hypothetical protein